MIRPGYKMFVYLIMSVLMNLLKKKMTFALDLQVYAFTWPSIILLNLKIPYVRSKLFNVRMSLEEEERCTGSAPPPPR